MCAIGRSVVEAGLVVGSGGNLSARLPGGDTCWVTGTSAWLDRLTSKNFVEVRLDDGAVVSSDRVPRTEMVPSLAIAPSPVTEPGPAACRAVPSLSVRGSRPETCSCDARRTAG